MMWMLLVACGNPVNSVKDSDSGSSTGTTDVELPDLVINEFLAANATILADEAGEYDDWVELYNYGDTLLNFEGLYLTDDKDLPTKFAFPADQGLAPGEFLIVWVDGEVDQGPLHTSFKLNKGGEMLSIYKSEGGKKAARVDGVEWTQETVDVSAARVPDGSTNWKHGTPTPGATNGG